MKKEAQEGTNARVDEKLCWLVYGDKNIDTSSRLANVWSLLHFLRFHFMKLNRVVNEKNKMATAAVGERKLVSEILLIDHQYSFWGVALTRLLIHCRNKGGDPMRLMGMTTKATIIRGFTRLRQSLRLVHSR